MSRVSQKRLRKGRRKNQGHDTKKATPPFRLLQTFSGTLDRSLRQKANSAIRTRTLGSQLATKANEGIEDRGMFSVFGQKRKKEPRDAKVRARFCGVRDYLYPRTAEEKMKKKMKKMGGEVLHNIS